MKIFQKIVEDKTGLRIDQPDSSGGTTSTGNVARKAFSDYSHFIECVLSIIAVEYRLALSELHTQLAAILKIFNSSQLENTSDFGKLCRHISLSVRFFSLGEHYANFTQTSSALRTTYSRD